MAKFERSMTVNAPPETVFGYVADISKHTEWSSHQLQVEPQDPGAAHIGSRYRTASKLLGSHNAELTITELAQPTRFAFECKDDTGEFIHWFEVAPTEGGTELTKGVEPIKKSLLLTLATPITGFIIPRNLDSDLEKIKQHLEAPGQ